MRSRLHPTPIPNSSDTAVHSFYNTARLELHPGRFSAPCPFFQLWRAEWAQTFYPVMMCFVLLMGMRFSLLPLHYRWFQLTFHDVMKSSKSCPDMAQLFYNEFLKNCLVLRFVVAYTAYALGRQLLGGIWLPTEIRAVPSEGQGHSFRYVELYFTCICTSIEHSIKKLA